MLGTLMCQPWFLTRTQRTIKRLNSKTRLKEGSRIVAGSMTCSGEKKSRKTATGDLC